MRAKIAEMRVSFSKMMNTFPILGTFFAFLLFFCLVLPIFEKSFPGLHTLEYAVI